ncbi:unnamed protein product [Pieris macdunnoughi]|uniref:Uncharacterized protein n=1 Tax=Pieris macdunnoughi TaxID=345717 RepID=A0A821Y4Z5_9NEOP|nr:unnamed protein product [Pieris macdunnoughi]
MRGIRRILYPDSTQIVAPQRLKAVWRQTCNTSSAIMHSERSRYKPRRAVISALYRALDTTKEETAPDLTADEPAFSDVPSIHHIYDR